MEKKIGRDLLMRWLSKQTPYHIIPTLPNFPKTSSPFLPSYAALSPIEAFLSPSLSISSPIKVLFGYQTCGFGVQILQIDEGHSKLYIYLSSVYIRYGIM